MAVNMSNKMPHVGPIIVKRGHVIVGKPPKHEAPRKWRSATIVRRPPAKPKSSKP